MDVKFEIVETLADLSTNKDWRRQLNKVKWYGKDAVYDIRSWHYPEGSDTPDRMGKGVTLNDEEFQALKNYLIGV